MKRFITGGRCAGKTALIRQNDNGGYVVFSNDNYARLCYCDNGIMIFTIIDEAYKDINPTKYDHLVKLGKHLKLGKKLSKDIKKSATNKKGTKTIKIKK